MLFNRKKRTEFVLGTVTGEQTGRTLFQEVVARFRRNKMAMVGMYILLILLTISAATILIDLVTGGSLYNDYVIQQNLSNKLQGPSTAHIFGCDEYGRDILLRMIWGARYSLLLGMSSILFAAAVGGVLGAIAAYRGGIVDNVIMRCMDILLAIPYMLLAIAVVSALGPSLPNLMLSIGIPEIPGFARIVRASVMTVKDREFVEAARSSGASDRRILWKYIIPNCLAPVIVQISLSVANAILSIAGLSYIGLGIQPPIPEWGAMLNSARNYIRDAMHITIIPGIGIMTTILALNVFGDGIRDALDPKLKD